MGTEQSTHSLEEILLDIAEDLLPNSRGNVFLLNPGFAILEEPLCSLTLVALATL